MIRKNHEHDIFIRAHRDYFDDLVKFCRSCVDNDPELLHNAEDWVQEAFCRAIQKKDIFLSHQNKKAWLIITCQNIIMNELNRKGVKGKHVAVSLDSQDEPSVEDVSARIDNWLVRQEHAEFIQKTIATLTQTEMAVYVDYFIEKVSAGDIAEKQGKQYEAIKAVIRRIRSKFRHARNNNWINFILLLWYLFGC